MTGKYLVTGGCGFIGSHIANKLNAMGGSVRVLDFAPRSNLDDGIEHIQGDVRSKSDVMKAIDGIEFVLHQAAIPSVPRSIKNPMYTHDCNVTGTVNLLIAAKDLGVRRFVYASSSSVYGKHLGARHEAMAPRPLSPYAVSKYAGECYCRSFRAVYDLPVTILRYFNVYGPGQKYDSPYSAVIPNFFSAVFNGHPAVIYGDGRQTRDFTYIEDVVNANILACEQLGKGNCVNVGTGKATSVLELLDTIEAVSGTKIEFCHKAERPGDLRDSVAYVRAAKELLGFSAFVGLESGLRFTWEWINSQ
jgi:UDP-N-acetylglucosamine/UDP-N-acetylgalactosamine 4-epimerase